MNTLPSRTGPATLRMPESRTTTPVTRARGCVLIVGRTLDRSLHRARCPDCRFPPLGGREGGDTIAVVGG